jgi:hypothetical protein
MDSVVRLQPGDKRQADNISNEEKWILKDAALTSMVGKLRLALKDDEASSQKLEGIAALILDYKRKLKDQKVSITKARNEVKALKNKNAQKDVGELDPEAKVMLEKYSVEGSSTRHKLKKVMESLQWDWNRRYDHSKKTVQEIEEFKSHKQIWCDLECILQTTQQSAVAAIQARASPAIVSKIMDSSYQLNQTACNTVGKVLGKSGRSNIFPSSNKIGLVNRQLEEIGYSKVRATLTEDKQSFCFDVSDFLKLLIDSSLIGNWDHLIPFVLCATMDGTAKGLLSAIIAGLKVAKDLEQNKCFDTDTGAIHSETFYLPLVGALCKENKTNSKKYFASFFSQLRVISEEGIFHRGVTWQFKFLLCTDLKAHWAILNCGGPTNDLKECCPEHKALRLTPIGICSSCLRRNPDRRKPCIHQDMHFREKSGDIEMPWTVPDHVTTPNTTKKKEKQKCVALVAEVAEEELIKPHNMELVSKELLKRFITERAIRENMVIFKQDTRHSLLQYCFMQERTFMWLVSQEAIHDLAMWIDRMMTIPDTLHMEIRVGEEFLTAMTQVCVMDRTDILPGETRSAQIEKKKEILEDVSAAMGRLISNNEFNNFSIRCEKNEPEIIAKIGMNNDRLRRVFNGMDSVIDAMYTESEQVTHSDTIAMLRSVTARWIVIRDTFRSDLDFQVHEADALQDKIDVWVIEYLTIFPKSGGCYLHMLHKGHMRDYLIIHKNLHKWSNIDSEAHNGFLKNMLSHRCQNNGYKGGKRGVDDDDDDHIEFIANCLMRMYMRRIMWLLDPTVLDRLEEAKVNCLHKFKGRDVLTQKLGTTPKTWGYDDYNLLPGLYEHLPVTYVRVNVAVCKPCTFSVSQNRGEGYNGNGRYFIYDSDSDDDSDDDSNNDSDNMDLCE